MSTVAELLRQSSQHLASISPTPRLDAELLLACALGCSRTHLWAWPQATPEPHQHERFRRLLQRRLRGEPVAYLLGRREFWSREFEVAPTTLIPRPETELLVEQALSLIPLKSRWRIADLGTGSGAIAISLALERPLTHVVATDICSQALRLAKSNARRLGARNVAFLLGDWLSALAAQSFDLIVTNPPYVAAADPHLKGEIRFEPAIALVAGDDGLDAFRRLIPQTKLCLKPGGFVLLEHGFRQAEAVAELLARAGFTNIVCHCDLEGRPRSTMACLAK
ncbi:MAG: peptide chain release factor N(5)-glutamine methyltransferase [Methylohalobius sp.]|nr:peptide chain release factor N(5)-glutamine methyltransferase [Methylohalobius sp.]